MTTIGIASDATKMKKTSYCYFFPRPNHKDFADSESEHAQWFYVFQEFWCFTLVALKWCLGFTLLRISSDTRWVKWIIYSSLILVTVCTGGTGMYLFFQCSPVE